MFEVFNVFIRDCFVPYELGLSVFVCGWAAVVFRRSILTDADNGVLTAFVPRP